MSLEIKSTPFTNEKQNHFYEQFVNGTEPAYDVAEKCAVAFENVAKANDVSVEYIEKQIKQMEASKEIEIFKKKKKIDPANFRFTKLAQAVIRVNYKYHGAPHVGW